MLAVGAAPRARVAEMVLHQHARDHRAALRRAQHRVVLARVEVRLWRMKNEPCGKMDVLTVGTGWATTAVTKL